MRLAADNHAPADIHFADGHNPVRPRGGLVCENGVVVAGPLCAFRVKILHGHERERRRHGDIALGHGEGFRFGNIHGFAVRRGVGKARQRIARRRFDGEDDGIALGELRRDALDSLKFDRAVCDGAVDGRGVAFGDIIPAYIGNGVVGGHVVAFGVHDLRPAGGDRAVSPGQRHRVKPMFLNEAAALAGLGNAHHVHALSDLTALRHDLIQRRDGDGPRGDGQGAVDIGEVIVARTLLA